MRAKAGWVLRHLRESGLWPDTSALNAALGRRVFRSDLYEKAARLCGSMVSKTYEKQISEPAPLSLI